MSDLSPSLQAEVRSCKFSEDNCLFNTNRTHTHAQLTVTATGGAPSGKLSVLPLSPPPLTQNRCSLGAGGTCGFWELPCPQSRERAPLSLLLSRVHIMPTWLMSVRLPWPKHPLLPLPKVMMMPRSGRRAVRKRHKGVSGSAFQAVWFTCRLKGEHTGS